MASTPDAGEQQDDDDDEDAVVGVEPRGRQRATGPLRSRQLAAR